MLTEKTLSIIKPDAVRKNIIGEIYQRFEQAGLKIIAVKMKQLSKEEARDFYAVHKNKPFFRDLIKFITSGPVIIQVLKGTNAITKNRELMGSTDPKEAISGTIRSDFGSSIDQNSVHGSDSLITASFEIDFFFNNLEIFECL